MYLSFFQCGIFSNNEKKNKDRKNLLFGGGGGSDHNNVKRFRICNTNSKTGQRFQTTVTLTLSTTLYMNNICVHVIIKQEIRVFTFTNIIFKDMGKLRKPVSVRWEFYF